MAELSSAMTEKDGVTGPRVDRALLEAALLSENATIQSLVATEIVRFFPEAQSDPLTYGQQILARYEQIKPQDIKDLEEKGNLTEDEDARIDRWYEIVYGMNPIALLADSLFDALEAVV